MNLLASVVGFGIALARIQFTFFHNHMRCLYPTRAELMRA